MSFAMPDRNPNYGRRTWQFEVGELRWIVKFDGRSSFAPLWRLAANGLNPVTVLNMGERQLDDWVGLASLVAELGKEKEG